MKRFFIFLALAGFTQICIAQKSVTIDVEQLKKPDRLLTVSSYDAILKRLIVSDHNDPNTIIAEGKSSGALVGFGYHPFFQGMYAAYAEHRPFTLSPDMIWLLISQGFAAHVNNNAESLRPLLVDFKGKQTLVVSNNKISLDDPNSPWEEVFSEFGKQIDGFIGPECSKTLTSDFTTTTAVSKVASQITMMSAVKSYFDFVTIMMACGIPKITLEGTPEDWQKVLNKTEALRKYKLDWWVDEMKPVLQNIIAASNGKRDTTFWQGIFKNHSKKYCGAPTTVDGWMVKFFPYDRAGKRNNLDSLSLKTDLPDEIVKVDLLYKKGDGKGNFNDTPLELWAGFTGLQQNNTDFTLKPEIGWMIRKKDDAIDAETIARLKQQASSTDVFNGIHVKGKEMPKELLQIGPIHNLQIDFSEDVRIPDEISSVPIDRLRIYGKITPEGIERLKKLMPKTHLIINSVAVGEAPGKY